jgi:ADP-ribose pyrophosphatase YjhB (NUDIX family)
MGPIMSHVEDIGAGGVVYDERQRILLIKPAREVYGYRIEATLPKGKVEQGESICDAASREVGEETGWDARIVCEIPGFHEGGLRPVKYFLMEALGKVTEPDEHTEEVLWLSFDDALTRVALTRNPRTRDRDTTVIRLAETIMHERGDPVALRVHLVLGVQRRQPKISPVLPCAYEQPTSTVPPLLSAEQAARIATSRSA